ncbi:MAG: hypothetical protein AAB522_02280 [Patescibacteria group bacterium]
MFKGKKILIYTVILAVFVALAFAALKFVPVLSVEGKKVNYSKFLKIKNALDQSFSISKSSTSEDLNAVAMMNLVEQEFLDILIDNVDRNLVMKAQGLVEEAIQKTPNLSLNEASEKLYGLNSEDFKQLVLLPQAKRDILENYFKEKNRDILQSWASLYGTASVKVYYPGYYWDTTEYIIKKK